MPFTVNCPICNRDGTASANAILNEKRGTQPINLAAMSAPRRRPGSRPRRRPSPPPD